MTLAKTGRRMKKSVNFMSLPLVFAKRVFGRWRTGSCVYRSRVQLVPRLHAVVDLDHRPGPQFEDPRADYFLSGFHAGKNRHLIAPLRTQLDLSLIHI